jgi:acyl-CoA synthetase (AMP-forming)/AMP-acid ligase II
VHEVVLIVPGSIPKTTSGKIQRRLTCRLWQENAFERISDSQSLLRGGLSGVSSA